MRYRPELDGLRGIAVLVVLASHAHVPGFAIDGGLAGVTLFFALSGYLITSLLAAEIAASGRIRLAGFYARRALRLLPALFAVLIVVAIGYSIGVWTSLAALPLTIASVVGYMANWAGIGGLQLGVLAHTWSLSVEEQFYLAWPLLLVAGIRFRRLAIALLVVAVLVTPWRFVLMGDGAGYARVFAGTDTHVDALFVGCAIALLGTRLPSAFGWLGLAATVVLGMTWASDAELPWFLPLATVGSALALAGCPASLRWAPLAYIGRISYGLYLWHYLFIWSGLPWPVVILASLLVASLSYIVIERPFLRLKDRTRRAKNPAPALLIAASAGMD